MTFLASDWKVKGRIRVGLAPTHPEGSPISPLDLQPAWGRGRLPSEEAQPYPLVLGASCGSL